MSAGRAQSRCGCGRGEPSPGADVGGSEPSPGADVGGPVPVQMWAAQSRCRCGRGEPNTRTHASGAEHRGGPAVSAWADPWVGARRCLSLRAYRRRAAGTAARARARARSSPRRAEPNQTSKQTSKHGRRRDPTGPGRPAGRESPCARSGDSPSDPSRADRPRAGFRVGPACVRTCSNSTEGDTCAHGTGPAAVGQPHGTRESFIEGTAARVQFCDAMRGERGNARNHRGYLLAGRLPHGVSARPSGGARDSDRRHARVPRAGRHR